MSKLTEIRWHGRGGQGAKTAAQLLAQACATAGKYVQAFPEYGPERMGAPVLSFNRIGAEPITLHCHVTNPTLVVVLDPTLVGPNVVEGVPEGGTIVVNTNRSPAEIKDKLGIKGINVYTVDANQISLETIGRVIPNTPMLGALIKVSDIISYEDFMAQIKALLEHKFATKLDVVPGNLAAIERAYEEVQGE